MDQSSSSLSARHSLRLEKDPAKSATLPGKLYGSSAAFVDQTELVLARTWHLVGHETAVFSDKPDANVLQWSPGFFLPGVLDEPFVWLRDSTGQWSCHSNVCPHRGKIVAEKSGSGRVLRCGYHGRRFGSSGACLSAPGFDEFEDFPSAQDGLAPLGWGRWRGLLFASLDPQTPFEEWIAPAEELLGFSRLESFTLNNASTRDYEFDAHWALYCDNYLEGFHIPYVHPGLAGVLDLDSYPVELYPEASVQVGMARKGEPILELPETHPWAGHPVAGLYLWLYPSLMLNLYPWGLSANIVQPLGPTRTKVSFWSLVGRPELRDTGAGAALHQVELEDEAVVESVQRGIRSRFYGRGRFSPRYERGVHHFHRLLGRDLGIS